jgi:hypothetical protein
VAEVQYVIDIAASMPAGEKTIAQLDTLTLALMGAGATADTLHDAVAQVSNAFNEAKVATAAANAELAAGQAQYAELERAALQAAKAEEKAAKLGVVPPEVAASSAAAAAALEDHSAKLSGLESAAGAAQAAEAKLAATLANTKQAAAAGNAELARRAAAAKDAAAAEKAALGEVEKAQKKATAEAEKAANASQAAHNKSVKEAEGLSPVVKGYRDLSDALSTGEGRSIVAAGALASLAAVVVAVGVALAAATVAFVAWSIGLADSARNAQLASEAMQAMHPELKALTGTIEQIGDATGMHADELQELAGRLKEAKVAAADMPAALKAAALAETALGKGGSADFVAQLKEGKVAASELSAEVEGKLGPIVAKQMKGLNAQSARLERNIGEIFGGLDIEPVLAGMQTLVALFDKNTAAGSAMKVIFEGVFQPIIDNAQTAAYFVEAFVLGFLIGLTKLYIVLKPAIKAVSEFFGFDDSSLADTLDVVKIAGELIVPVFAGFVIVLGAIAAGIALTIAPALALTAAFYALVAGVVYAVGWLAGKFFAGFQAIRDYLGNFSLVDLGANIITGLANGLVNAGPAVLRAITGVVSGAIDSAKKLLGIASPSKVFAAIGDDTGQGFVNGVDAMAGDAQSAMAAMVEPPESPLALQAGLSKGPGGGPAAGASSGGGSADGGGAGASVIINGNVVFEGVKDAKEGVVRFGEWLLDTLEGDAASLSPKGAP